MIARCFRWTCSTRSTGSAIGSRRPGSRGSGRGSRTTSARCRRAATGLLRDLLAAELAARRRRGERPEPREYRDRFPGEAEVVAAAFSPPSWPLARLSDQPTEPSPIAVISCERGGPRGRPFLPRVRPCALAGSDATASLHIREDGDEPRARRDSSPASPLDSSHHGHFLPGTRIADATASCRWWEEAAWARSTGPTT